jgi:RND family efflux transporter MFP subunit
MVATYVENFEFVQAQQPIVRLLDPSSIEFDIFVPESLIVYAPYVQSATVRFDAYPDLEVGATIKEISKEASQATRTYPVTLLMDVTAGIEILPGMAGKATILAELPEGSEEVGTEIPATAVFASNNLGTSYVWVVDETNKTISRREIGVGKLTDFGILVKSGLEAGEWIVFKGVNSLNDGQKVRIIADDSEGQS